MKHVWEEHLSGDLYTDDEYLEWREETCAQCGDADRYLGAFETVDELIQELLEYDLSEIQSLFKEDTQQ
ncbi:hypothetical protein ACRW9N_13265 [Listeria aquatica]|uniref:hypothetical protein n=1 Tax=Listeria aquatica TaxID=1494960 RepID=UPI003EF1AD34